MNTDQLRYLIEISKNPSLSIASQKLHITPQALSTAIKKLEDELGFELLNRSFKGISLTMNGEWLVQEAVQFLDKIDTRKNQYLHTTAKQSHKGSLDIAINRSGISDSIVAQLIVQLYEQEPELRIALKELPKESIFSAIRTQEIEYGFIFRTKANGNYIDELDDDLTFDALFCGDLVLATAFQTELAKFNSVTLKKAIQYPICTYNALPSSKDYLHYLLTDIFNLSPQYEVETNFSIYKHKVKNGIANAFIVHFPAEIIPSNYVENTKLLQLRDDIKIYFGFIRKRDVPLSNNGAFFLQELRGLIHDLKYPEHK